MKPSPFSYHRPATTAELVGILGALPNAKILAGGQSLMPMMNMRFVQPDHVIDINRIPDLAGIRETGDILEIGAMTRQSAILASSTVKRHSPLLVEALAEVGHMQTRARGTLGGSLCHLDPAAEQPSCALALDAILVAAGPGGEQEIKIDDWFVGYMTPALESGKFLKSIRIKRWADHFGYAFVEFARRHGDFALASAACMLAVDGSRRINRVSLVVSGIGTRPLRCAAAEKLLIGEVPGQAVFAAAAKTISEFEILADSYGSSDYRRQLATGLLERALARASDRAQEQYNG